MAARDRGTGSQPRELYARALAACERSRALAARFQVAQGDLADVLQRIYAARDRVERVHDLWLAPPRADRLRYSAYARLQARLASMPVIEQAKGILMAQWGWPEDQAFDALRRVSQRENIKVRDLAAMIVAKTAHPDDSAYSRLQANQEIMPVVEQAKGILMAQRRCRPDEAFGLLRQASQQANIKVHAQAARIVEQIVSSHNDGNVTPITRGATRYQRPRRRARLPLDAD